ncbi:MAG: uroporphyrinogen decarboxylase family protein [Burkholderiales bacterium]
MKKIERVRAALRSEAVDRPPYGFWTHMPGIDLDPRRLAEETAGLCARYDLDFVKSMPNGLYCVEDWGCVCDYSDIERGGVAKVVSPAVVDDGQWAALGHLDVTRGAFGRELEHLRGLVQGVGPEVPVLATVFSPLTIAGKLSNGESRSHLAGDPQRVCVGLEVIAEVTCAFTRKAIELGCAGVFLAVQEATRNAFDESDYRRFGVPFDRQVLAAAEAAGAWFNVVHIHGEDILFDVLKDYNATALNWHIGETPPTVAQYRSSGGSKPILGGLQRMHITRRDRAAIGSDIATAIVESGGRGGRGLLLAPACVIRHPVDDATLRWTAAQIKALAI